MLAVQLPLFRHHNSPVPLASGPVEAFRLPETSPLQGSRKAHLSHRPVSTLVVVLRASTRRLEDKIEGSRLTVYQERSHRAAIAGNARAKTGQQRAAPATPDWAAKTKQGDSTGLRMAFRVVPKQSSGWNLHYHVMFMLPIDRGPQITSTATVSAHALSPK